MMEEDEFSQCSEAEQEKMLHKCKERTAQIVDICLVQKYHEFFPTTFRQQLDDKIKQTNYPLLFQNHGIFYDLQSQLQPQMTLTLIRHSINWEVLEFMVAWGNFQIPIRILNVMGQSESHNNCCLKGSYGSIYWVNLLGKEFIMKCINSNKIKSCGSAFYVAAKEYFLLKIASALKIGPALETILGFDLIMYEKCVEFAVQVCQELTSLSNEHHHQLKESLYLMHKFSIVHFDIKPDNIMYSPTFQKCVFIDFGLSELTNKEVGCKFQTFFRGTLVYSSIEMIETFWSNQIRSIDVYTNDVYCLKSSIEFMRFKNNNSQELDSYENKQIISQKSFIKNRMNRQNSLMLFLIKFCIFTNNVNKLKELYAHHERAFLTDFTDDILIFLTELAPSEVLKQFYHATFKTYKKEGIEYNELNDIYKKGNDKLQRNFKPNQDKIYKFRGYFARISDFCKEDYEYIYTKENIEGLFSSQKNSKIDISVYFSLYMSYINFSNNIYEIDMKKRIQLTKLIYSSRHLKLEKPFQDIEEIAFIQQTISLIFKELIWEQQKKYSPFRMKLIHVLIEHMFILNIGDEIELIDCLNLAYHSQMRECSHKIEFLLKVKHNCCWFQHRIKSDNPQIVIQIMNEIVLQWYYEKICHLKQEKSHKYIWIVQYLKKSWRSPKVISIAADKRKQVEKLQRNFKRQLKLQILTNEILNTQTKELKKKINQLYDQMGEKFKIKISYVLFHIFTLYVYQLNDEVKCHQIITLIDSHVKSLAVMKNMDFFFIEQLAVNKRSDTVIDIFTQFLSFLNLHSIIAYQHLIKCALQYIASNTFILSLDEAKTNKFRSVLNRVIGLINFEILFEKNNFMRIPRHLCLNYNSLINLISLKLVSSNIQQQIYDFEHDLSILTKRSLATNCERCIFIAKNIYQLDYQYISMAKIAQTASKICQIQQELFQQSQLELAILHEQYSHFEQVEFFKMLNIVSLYTLCSISKKYESKYGGIEKLYRYNKKTGGIMYYFNLSSFHFQLLQLTIEIVYQKLGLIEVCDFFHALAKYVIDCNSPTFYYILLCAMNKFIFQFHSSINYHQLMCLLYKNSINLSTNNYNNIYLTILIFFIPFELQDQYQVKIAKSITSLPSTMKYYVEAHYYRFLVYKYCSARQTKIHDIYQPKKRKWLEKKLMKLFHVLGKVVPKKRTNRSSHARSVQILRDKISKIGTNLNLEIISYDVINIKVQLR